MIPDECIDRPTWTMQTIPLSEAKARLSELADEVNRTHERIQVTRNGRKHVVLISADDLASLEATLELLADPDAVARLREGEAAVERGDVTTGNEMRTLMDERRRAESPDG